jgi:hypothetical protein
MAGSTLGAGLPTLLLHNSHNSAAAAATTITLEAQGGPAFPFQEVTFAKLGAITDDIQNQQSCSAGTCTSTPANVPPLITLREPYAAGIATYLDIFKWEQLSRAGNPIGTTDVTLTLANSATGKTIATYVMDGAWVTNLDVAAGAPQSVDFTVTITGKNLLLQSTSG